MHHEEPRKIKLRRALILGNFYGTKVRILTKAITQGYETILDTVVGINPDFVLTKTGRKIPINSIETIYQL